MKIKTALIIIGITAALFALGLVGVVVVGRTAQAIREKVSSETARQQFIATWRPPAELTPGLLFPERVAGFVQSMTNTASPKSPTLPFPELPGLRATYERPGRAAIEIFAARVNALEAEAVCARAKDAFDSRGGVKTRLEFPGRLRLSSTEPQETVELWLLQEWLFRFRAEGELEADFIRDYLLAIRGPAGN